MHHLEQDIAYFVAKSPYMRLCKLRSALPFLREEAAKLREYQATLALYPAVKCEPLDFAYSCLEGLGMIRPTALEDLISFGWRGVVWGSFLVALQPEDEYRRRLHGVADLVPENRWIVDVAIDPEAGRTQVDLAEAASLVAFIRKALEGLPRPSVPLRDAPPEELLAELQSERREISRAYKMEGAAAALERFRSSKYPYFLSSYRDWRLGLRDRAEH